MDDILASAQVVLEGVDKVSPAATSSIDALKRLAATGADVQRQLINAAQNHQQTLQVLNKIYAQNQQAAQAAGTGATQAANAASQAVQKHTQTVQQVPPALNAAGRAANQLQKQLTDAFSVYAIEEFIRKSYMAFTSQELAMRRVQLAAGGTTEEINKVHRGLHDIATETNQATENMAKAFRDFQARSGLGYGEAVKAFRAVADAADLAGVHVDAMSRVATAAMAQLNINDKELSQLMGAFGKAFAGMGSEALHVMPNIIALMQRLHITGKDALEGVAAAIQATGKLQGSAEGAARGYQAIVDLASRPDTRLGYVLQDKVQAVADHIGDTTDLYAAALEKMREEWKKTGGNFRSEMMQLNLMFEGNQDAIQTARAAMKLSDEEFKKYIQDLKEKMATEKEAAKLHEETMRGAIDGTRKLIGAWNDLELSIGGLLDKLGATDSLNSTVTDLKKLTELLEWLDKFMKEHMSMGGLGGVTSGFGLGTRFREHILSLPPAFSMGTPAPPRMQSGGVVTEPTVAMIGEAGPEAVVPLGGGGADMRGADGGTQAEREAAEMWGRLHGLAGARHKHVDLKGQLSQEELDKILQAEGGGGPGGGGRDTGWGPGSGRGGTRGDGTSRGDGRTDDNRTSDVKPPPAAAPLPTQGAAGIPGLPGSPSGPALTPEERKAAGAPSGGTGGEFQAGGKYSKSQQAAINAVVNEWRKAGMSDVGIAGVLANIREESTFDPTLRHPDQPKYGGEAHFAHGLYQEGGAEWNNYVSWMQRNYPKGDWRDPKLQSEFAAKNLREGIGDARYKAVWERMKNAKTPAEAAAAYVEGYLKPAAKYREKRVREFRAGGAPGLETYGTGTGGPAEIARPDLPPIGQVAGLPGGPSGPSLTPEQRKAAATGGGGGGGEGGGSVISPFPGAHGFGIGSSNVYGAGRSGGRRAHSGNDLHAGDSPGSTPNGTPVVSMTGGTVLYNGRNSGYGANIVIRGDDGIIRRYAVHGSTADLKPGAHVDQGQFIGRIGENHLHYEEIPPTRNGRDNPVYHEFERNARTNTFTNTANQRGTVDPSGPHGSLQNIGKKKEQVDQATGPTKPGGKGTKLFIHGMNYERFGDASKIQDEIEADVRRQAAAEGYDNVEFVRGSNNQQKIAEADARLKKGGITKVDGFSQGGYIINNHLRKRYPKIAMTDYGATKSGADPNFPGVKHMQLPKAAADRAVEERKAREAKAAPAPAVRSAEVERGEAAGLQARLAQADKEAAAAKPKKEAAGPPLALKTAKAMAEGGIVTRPTDALVGEAGPEAIIPLDGGGSSSLDIDSLLRQHAELQAHMNQNPIEVPMAEPHRMGGGRQPFGRMIEMSRRKTEARRTAHEVPLDTGPM